MLFLAFPDKIDYDIKKGVRSMLDSGIVQSYIDILHEELVPATAVQSRPRLRIALLRCKNCWGAELSVSRPF